MDKTIQWVVIGAVAFVAINALTKNKLGNAIGAGIVSGTTSVVSGALTQVGTTAKETFPTTAKYVPLYNLFANPFSSQWGPWMVLKGLTGKL